ncbi:MAG: SpoIIE family protein phosphatase [Bacteroidota bacterium]
MLNELVELKKGIDQLDISEDQKKDLQEKLSKVTKSYSLMEFKLDRTIKDKKAVSSVLSKTIEEIEKLSMVVKETDNAIAVFDSNADLEWVNDGFVKLFGYTMSEYIEANGSCKIWEMSSNNNIRDTLKNVINQKKTLEYETVNYSKEGRKFWVHTTLTPIFDNNNNLKRIIIIDSDITKTKEAEHELERQRNIAIQQQREIIDKNHELEQQTEEILSQRDRIEDQKDLLEVKNKEITESIQYAEHIQSAILPPHDLINEILPDSFIFFKPKDLLSGDIYWIEAYNGLKYFAAIDCTGHGIPGALISIFVYNLLNQALKIHELTEPASIIEYVNKEVSQALTRHKKKKRIGFGMDLTLCAFDPDNNRLYYSGVFNPMYLIRDEEIIHCPMNEEAIDYEGGVFQFRCKNNFIDLQRGDLVYLFSDGFPDQFGEGNNKKFKRAPFRKLLLDNHHKPMEEQKAALNESLHEWKGSLPQTDDILIIGVRF